MTKIFHWLNSPDLSLPFPIAIKNIYIYIRNTCNLGHLFAHDISRFRNPVARPHRSYFSVFPLLVVDRNIWQRSNLQWMPDMRGLIQPRVVSFIDFVPMPRVLLHRQLTAPRQIVASMHNNLEALVESSNSNRIEWMYVSWQEYLCDYHTRNYYILWK